MSSIYVGTITFDPYPVHPRVRGLVEAALDAGYAADVICLRLPGEKPYEVCNGAQVYRLPMNKTFGKSLPLMLLIWCWFMLMAGVVVTRLHLKRHYDVIHVHNMPDFLVFSTLIPWLLGAKIILDVQDVSPELMAAKAKGRLKRVVIRLAAWQEHISTAFAHHVVTVGWPFEELLLQRGIPKEKMTIILNSADPKFFPPSHQQVPSLYSLNKSLPFILMYHGTLAERTGVDIAVRALALAHRVAPQLQLDIMGFGECKPALRQLAEELGVSEAVKFTEPGHVKEVVNFILRGDVGIIPYRCDGFQELCLPTKVYEYAFMRRPIIASNTRGIRSMFRPESIVLCEPDNPESFSEAIIDLYQHPEKRASLIANASADYQPYRWESEAERYQILLASLSRKHVGERYPVVNK